MDLDLFSEKISLISKWFCVSIKLKRILYMNTNEIEWREPMRRGARALIDMAQY